jgi:hypothetical protein
MAWTDHIRDIIHLLQNAGFLKMVVSYFAVPLGALIISWLIQHSIVQKIGAGLDLFVFLTALDLGFLADPVSFHGRLGTEAFHPGFVVLLLWSIIMDHGRRKSRAND